jgi:hypothetical protein
MNAVLSDFTQTVSNPYNEMLNIGTLNQTCWNDGSGAQNIYVSMEVNSNPQATKSISPVQSGDTFCLVFDNYFPNWLPWSSGSVFTTIQSGIAGCSQTSTILVTDCGDNNVIDIGKCGSCGTLTFVPNNKIPPNFEVPILYVNNGITLSMKPNYNGGYLIATLFQNNVTLTYPNIWSGPYKEFMNNIRSAYNIPIGNNYITRYDAVLGSNGYAVLYYTTLSVPAQDTYQTYVSDTAIIVNGTTIIGSTTNTDPNKKFSDKHIRFTGGKCKDTYQCDSYSKLSIVIDMWGQNIPTIQISGIDGFLNPFDLGYFYVFKALIPGWTAKCRIKGQRLGWDSGTTDFQISDCLDSNLSSINFSYHTYKDYIQGTADLYDDKGKIFIVQTTGEDSKTFKNCTQN